jgi:hypothetical protein
MSHNTAALRELIETALGDDELHSLCYDHFRPVYDSWTQGQTRPQKV